MKTQFAISLFIATALVSSCSNEEENILKNGGEEVTFALGGVDVVMTKATTTTTDYSTYTTSFEADDKIGIYSTGLVNDKMVSSNMNNAIYTASADGKLTPTASTAYYFPLSGTANFYAYYPAMSDMSSSVDTNTTGAVSFTVASNQSTVDAFKQSDFMTCAKSSSNAASVTLNFTHRLALVEITLVNLNSSTVVMNGIHPKVTWTYGENESLVTSTEENDKVDVSMYNQASNVFWALVPAQTIAKGETLFTITHNNSTYYYSVAAENGLTFTANKVNKFKLTRVSVGSSATLTLTANGWETNDLSGANVEAKNYAGVPKEPVTVTGFGGVKNASSSWNYVNNQGITSANLSDNVFSITSTFTTNNNIHWANTALFHYSSEKLDASKYTLSFKVSSTASTGAKVQYSVYSADTKNSDDSSGTTTYYNIYPLEGTSPSYNSKDVSGETSVTVTFDASKIISSTNSPSSAANSSSPIETIQKYYNAGFIIGISFAGSAEGISYTLSDVKVTKNDDQG